MRNWKPQRKLSSCFLFEVLESRVKWGVVCLGRQKCKDSTHKSLFVHLLCERVPEVPIFSQYWSWTAPKSWRPASLPWNHRGNMWADWPFSREYGVYRSTRDLMKDKTNTQRICKDNESQVGQTQSQRVRVCLPLALTMLRGQTVSYIRYRYFTGVHQRWMPGDETVCTSTRLEKLAKNSYLIWWEYTSPLAPRFGEEDRGYLLKEINIPAGLWTSN